MQVKLKNILRSLVWLDGRHFVDEMSWRASGLVLLALCIISELVLFNNEVSGFTVAAFLLLVSGFGMLSLSLFFYVAGIFLDMHYPKGSLKRYVSSVVKLCCVTFILQVYLLFAVRVDGNVYVSVMAALMGVSLTYVVVSSLRSLACASMVRIWVLYLTNIGLVWLLWKLLVAR
ncbi:hypothetical protein AB4254_08690 [Vibrio breoganii]